MSLKTSIRFIRKHGKIIPIKINESAVKKAKKSFDRKFHKGMSEHAMAISSHGRKSSEAAKLKEKAFGHVKNEFIAGSILDGSALVDRSELRKGLSQFVKRFKLGK